jgi:predicted metalloprotease
MRWEGREESQNVEDRRGLPAGGGMIIGGGIGTLVMILLAVLLGANPMQILDQVGAPSNMNNAPEMQERGPVDPREEPYRRFVAVVLKDTEDVWTDLFQKDLNRGYERPKLILFTGEVRSACGVAGSAVGPFYCPGDTNVYLDLGFFHELSDKLGAKGELAMAYVVAHEVGHHVQNLLGISEQVQRYQARGSKAEANQISVRTELQADYLAGVFIRHAQETKQILEKGDIESAMVAANQIGDDTLQRRATGSVRREQFTHGSSEQRKRWLSKGMETGSLREEDLMATFNLPYESL